MAPPPTPPAIHTFISFISFFKKLITIYSFFVCAQFQESKAPYIEEERNDILNYQLQNEFKVSSFSLLFHSSSYTS